MKMQPIFEKLSLRPQPLKYTVLGCGAAGFHIVFREFLPDVAQTEGDVLIDCHVRPESIVLEQESDLTFICWNVDAFF